MRRILSLLSLLAAVLFVPLPHCEHEPLPAPALTGDLIGPTPSSTLTALPSVTEGYLTTGVSDAGTGVYQWSNVSGTLYPAASDSGLVLPGGLVATISEVFTKESPVGHMYCSIQDRGQVDLGELPPSYSDTVLESKYEADNMEMRGIPMWQWHARCMLWTKHEYEWKPGSGVVVISKGSGRSP